jgi:hypothetical protein
MLSTLTSILILLTLGYFVYCCLWEIGWWLASRVRPPRFSRHLTRHVHSRRQIVR